MELEFRSISRVCSVHLRPCSSHYACPLRLQCGGRQVIKVHRILVHFPENLSGMTSMNASCPTSPMLRRSEAIRPDLPRPQREPGNFRVRAHRSLTDCVECARRRHCVGVATFCHRRRRRTTFTCLTILASSQRRLVSLSTCQRSHNDSHEHTPWTMPSSVLNDYHGKYLE